MTKQDAYEAASLAALIGSQLKNLDNMTVERTNNPANKINIHDFISKVKDPNATVAPKSYLTQVPAGWAQPIPEHIVQQMVPDMPRVVQQPTPEVESIKSVETNNQLVSKFEDSGNRATLPTAVPSPVEQKNTLKTSTDKNNDRSVLTRSDIDSIRNSLKNIDKSLAGMLECMKIEYVKFKKHD